MINFLTFVDDERQDENKNETTLSETSTGDETKTNISAGGFAYDALMDIGNFIKTNPRKVISISMVVVIIICSIVIGVTILGSCGGSKSSNDYERLIENYFEQELKGAVDYSYEIIDETSITSDYRYYDELTAYIEHELDYEEESISGLREYETEVYVNFERYTVCFMIGQANGITRIFDVDEGGLWGESDYEHVYYQAPAALASLW